MLFITGFVLLNSCKKEKKTDVNNEEVEGQIQKHRSNELERLNYPDTVYSFIIILKVDLHVKQSQNILQKCFSITQCNMHSSLYLSFKNSV